jgi:hypothetical protein
MGGVLVTGALALFVGAAVQGSAWVAVPVVFVWLFGSGLLIGLGGGPMVIGLLSGLVLTLAFLFPGGVANGAGYAAGGAIGGLWAIAITLIWPTSPAVAAELAPASSGPAPGWAARVGAELGPRSPAARYALQLGLATAIGQWLVFVADLPHGPWVTSTIVVILKPDFGATLQTTIERVITTVIGATVAAAAMAVVQSELVRQVTLIPVAVAMVAYQRISGRLFGLLLTLYVLLVTNLTGPSGVEVGIDRTVDTLIGAVIAVLVGAVVIPMRKRGEGASETA